MTKYCNNCRAEKESWIDYPSYNSSETFARKERCWSCKRWTLSREVFANVSLNDNNLVFFPFILPLIGIREAKNFFTGKDLEDQIKKRTEINGIISDVVRFEPWWSNNCATIVDYFENYYRVFLIVYKEGFSANLIVFPINHSSENYWGDSGRLRKKHNCLSDAQNEATWLRQQLTSSGKYYDHPILLVHPNCNNYCSFSEIIREPYVEKRVLPCEEKVYYDLYDGEYKTEKIPTKEPDKYLKPLDVVWVERSIFFKEYHHVGIYLGNKQVCHVSDVNSKKIDTRNTNRVIITNWDKFIEGYFNEEVFIYHHIIPFRNYEEIAKNIAWDEDNRHIEGKYCVANNNCEHYANSRIFGLNYSKQVEERPSESAKNAKYLGINNGKSNFNLKSELEWDFNELKNNWRSQEIERRYLQEIPAKRECKIM